MHVHLVFVTKYRRNVFTKQILEDLRKVFVSVCTDFEAHLVEFEGEGDHVHLLVEYPPKMAISKLVNSLKGVHHVSFVRKAIRAYKMLYGEAASGLLVILRAHAEARHLAIVRQYIEQQKPPET